jgi:L-lactate dehydrogenase complex protein LldG
MTGAREVILSRIGTALADRPAAAPVPRTYERALPPDVDRVELFAERVAHYQATVLRSAASQLAGTIATVLADQRATSVAVPGGVPAVWLPSTGSLEIVRDDPPLSHAEADGLDGTVTGCAVAIAETGTIILDAGPDQGRRVLTLLPDLHICVVPVDRIVGTVPEALDRLDPSRVQTWISGPSATSDIELQRVEGVHGPRRLVVIILDA